MASRDAKRTNPHHRPIKPRGRLWKKNRRFIIARDQSTCQYCRKGPLASTDAHVDHIRPLVAGGEDELWNYALACERCNKVKSDRWSAELVIGERPVQAFYEDRRRAAQTPGAVLPVFTAKKDPDALEPFKAGRAGRHGGKRKLLDEVERMWQAFVEKPSSRHVSITCQVSHTTASRYINLGDPARGIEPFADRLTRIRQEASRRADQQLTRATTRNLVIAQQLLEAMVKKIAITDEAGNVVDLAIAPDFRDIVEMGRFIQVLSGGVDRRTERVDRFGTMSNDQLEAYITRARKALADAAQTVELERSADGTFREAGDAGDAGAKRE